MAYMIYIHARAALAIRARCWGPLFGVSVQLPVRLVLPIRRAVPRGAARRIGRTSRIGSCTETRDRGPQQRARIGMAARAWMYII